MGSCFQRPKSSPACLFSSFDYDAGVWRMDITVGHQAYAALAERRGKNYLSENRKHEPLRACTRSRDMSKERRKNYNKCNKRPKSSPVRPLACNWYHCAQLIAKPKAACALRFSWAATSSNLGLWADVTSCLKPEVYNVSVRRQRRTEPRT